MEGSPVVHLKSAVEELNCSEIPRINPASGREGDLNQGPASHVLPKKHSQGNTNMLLHSFSVLLQKV